jgi:hypothetical protein
MFHELHDPHRICECDFSQIGDVLHLTIDCPLTHNDLVLRTEKYPDIVALAPKMLTDSVKSFIIDSEASHNQFSRSVDYMFSSIDLRGQSRDWGTDELSNTHHSSKKRRQDRRHQS